MWMVLQWVQWRRDARLLVTAASRQLQVRRLPVIVMVSDGWWMGFWLPSANVSLLLYSQLEIFTKLLSSAWLRCEQFQVHSLRRQRLRCPQRQRLRCLQRQQPQL